MTLAIFKLFSPTEQQAGPMCFAAKNQITRVSPKFTKQQQ